MLQINFIGGPEGDPDLRGRQRGARPAWSTWRCQHRRLLHQRHARGRLPQAHRRSRVAEQRKNGAFDAINKIWDEKGNMRYLARMVENQPFHLYLNKKIDKPDLTGLKIRITPVYRDFFQALGANVDDHAARRGVHRARARRGRRLRLADRRHLRPQLAGEDQVPRRPRLLRRRGVAHHEPRRLQEAARRSAAHFLDKQALALEAQNDFWKTYSQRRDRAPGRRPASRRSASTPPTTKAYVDKAYDVGWAGAMKASPEFAKKLKTLLVEVNRAARLRSRRLTARLLEALALVACALLLRRWC